jgi:RimJ/RimL family protein N-acetyltransferase
VDRDAETLFLYSNGSPITLGERHMPAYDADALIWQYLYWGPFTEVTSFRDYLADDVSKPDALCFCVRDAATGTPLGTASLMSNAPAHLKIELGSIWYSPIAQRTGANLEAAYLMLRHVFALGYRRAEWKCNAENHRSRVAAEKLGFRFEGIQEAHAICKGKNRDTAWFRLLDHEWEGVRERLEARLYGGQSA